MAFKIQKLFTGHDTKKDNRYFLTLLVLMAITIALFSVVIGMKQSVWFDEAYSVSIAQKPLKEIVEYSAVDMHPPFYYMVLKLWGWAFGFSDLAMRSMSALFMAGAAIFAALAARRMFGARAAVVGVTLMVISPMILRFGFEIRMYALAAFICSAATYVILKALQLSEHKQKDHQLQGRNYWILYAILIALGFYTLYFTAFVWAAHFVWLVLLNRRALKFKQLKTYRWVKAYLLSALLVLPWVPIVSNQMSGNALATVGKPLTPDNIIGIAAFNFVYQPTWELTMFTWPLVIFVILTLLVVAIRAYKLGDKRTMYWLAISLLVVPFLCMFIMTLFKPSYIERYLSHMVPLGMAMIGCLIYLAEQHKPSRLVRVSAGLLIVIQVVGLFNLYNYGNYNFQRLERPTVKYLSSLMKSDCKKGATIVAADPYVATELNYYLPECAISFYSQSAELSGGYAPLSESPLRIDNPVQKQHSNILYYVYYGQPQLHIDEAFKAVDRAKLGNMTVEKFSAE